MHKPFEIRKLIRNLFINQLSISRVVENAIEKILNANTQYINDQKYNFQKDELEKELPSDGFINITDTQKQKYISQYKYDLV